MTSRLQRFGIVGIINTAVGLGVIYLAMFAGLGDFASNALGYGCGLILSFFLHRGWTFAGSGKSLPRDATGFVLAWIAAYLLNLAVIASGRRLGFVDNSIVQLAGVGVFAASFYLLTNRIVFTARKSANEESSGIG